MLRRIVQPRHRTLSRAVLALPVLLIALVATACGDDDVTEGPTTATVSGVVTDHPTDVAIPGVTVTGTALGGQLFSVTTDSSGMYEATFDVEDVPTDLAITADGDRFVAGDTTVAFAGNVTLDFQLMWDDPFVRDCIGVDPGNVSIQQSGTDFTVVDGSTALMVFPELSEAQDARDLVQHYGFNALCYVGRPDPDMTYWLNDNAPMLADSGAPVAEDCIAVDPHNVTIEQSGSNYVVADGSTSLMAFPELTEAQDAVELIEFYGFTNLCFVGRPDPGMQYWLR